MELDFTKFKCIIFVICLSFVINSHAMIYIDRSNYNAFKIIQSNLGIDTEHPSFFRNPCVSPSVSCERRVLNFTTVLKITRVVYNSEELSGSLSPLIGKLSEIKELTLSDNHLVGQLPRELAYCRKLEVLDLKNNRFSGHVPSELSKLGNLKELDLSSNQFSGDLSFLRYFPNLERLSLADNLFRGKIPASVRSFRNLNFFDVSGNDYIQGPIPVLDKVEYISSETSRKSQALKRYKLAENLDKNSSQSPRAARTRRNVTHYPAPAPAPSANEHPHNHRSTKKKLIAWGLGFLAGGAVGGIAGLAFSVLIKMALILYQDRGKGSGPAIFSPLIKKAEDLAFLEKEDSLASLQLIGKGGCGEVYKAELPNSNGKIIAIKKVVEPPKEAAELTEEESRMLNKRMRQIRSEIQTVGRIRHRHLLPLLAHVPRPDCHYLIYEYMKNGSLDDRMRALYQENKEFDWPSRFKVALGVASGLEYLHINNNPKIIHRDLKPANILLDDDMEPRIADFGLAKEMPVDNTHMSTSHVAGTVGYIAPEYHQTVKFTDKCDIYSFGVVLGTLVMGKLPGDEFFQHTEELSLVKWMRNVMTSEEPKRALDPKLIGNGYEEQMLQVLKIACFCTLDDPKQRPNSKDVRCMLSQITHQVQI